MYNTAVFQSKRNQGCRKARVLRVRSRRPRELEEVVVVRIVDLLALPESVRISSLGMKLTNLNEQATIAT